jgi:CRP-like cAMP-binding protein
MSSDDALSQRFARDFPRGAVLFREGDPGADMFVVQRGHVRISRTVGGVEKVLSTLGAGEFFGEMSALSGHPRSATATCVEDARLLVVDGAALEPMLRANGEIAVRMIRRLAERLRGANDQIERLLQPDPTPRVLQVLVAHAARVPPPARPLRPAEVAAAAVADAARVEQVLARLARAGAVVLADGAVTVPDAARLRRFAEYERLRSEFGEGA